MFNYYYRQNSTPTVPTTPTSLTTPTTPSVVQTTASPTPYSQMQSIITDIIELYHKEMMNMNMYQQLLEVTNDMEQEEAIEEVIENTANNLNYLRQIYLGLTGDTLEELPIESRAENNVSYNDLLKGSLLSKLDTLNQYEYIYRVIPIRPYQDILFGIMINQLKDAAIYNYLISTYSQSQLY